MREKLQPYEKEIKRAELERETAEVEVARKRESLEFALQKREEVRRRA